MYESLEEQNRKYNRDHKGDLKIDPQKYPYLWKELNKRDEYDHEDVTSAYQRAQNAFETEKKRNQKTTAKTVQSGSYKQAASRTASRNVYQKRNFGTTNSSQPSEKKRTWIWVGAILAILFTISGSFIGIVSSLMENVGGISDLIRDEYVTEDDDWIDDDDWDLDDFGGYNEVDGYYAEHFDEITEAWMYSDSGDYIIFYKNEDSSYCGYINRYTDFDETSTLEWYIGDAYEENGVYEIADLYDDTITVSVEEAADGSIYLSTDESGDPKFYGGDEVKLKALEIDETFYDFLVEFDENYD